MSSRAMYSCDLGGGIMPSAEASDSASDTFERSEAAVETLQLCRFEERRDFLPLGGLLPSSGSKLASCFDCQEGLLISKEGVLMLTLRRRSGVNDGLGGGQSRQKRLLPDTLTRTQRISDLAGQPSGNGRRAR